MLRTTTPPVACRERRAVDYSSIYYLLFLFALFICFYYLYAFNWLAALQLCCGRSRRRRPTSPSPAARGGHWLTFVSFIFCRNLIPSPRWRSVASAKNGRGGDGQKTAAAATAKISGGGGGGIQQSRPRRRFRLRIPKAQR